MISLRSVRFQLLAAVNAAIALLFGIFLILDYRREIAERVAEKHVALEEETKTLLPAVIRMRPYGEQAVQRYIDDVCGRMRDTLSPGHHIINHRLAVVCRTENFASMFVARCDPEAKRLQYASAGHESGLLLPAKGNLTELPSTGLVLGVAEDAVWDSETLALEPGDRLLLVTDGVTEAMNREGELFGRKRLANTFEAYKDVGIHEAVERIGHAVTEYCADYAQTDDVTLLAFEVAAGLTAERVNG